MGDNNVCWSRFQPILFGGIDDLALRKGRTYGTVLVDLARHRVIDLFGYRPLRWTGRLVCADMDVGTPTVEVVTRDLGPAYANACSAGAPMALQVADRFHLVCNIRELVERLFEQHSSALDAALEPPAPTAASQVEAPPTPELTGGPDLAATTPTSDTPDASKAVVPSYGYDAASNLVTVTDPLGHVGTTVYDALNRAVATVDALGQRSTAVFDAAGNRVATVDALNRRTTVGYDAADRAVTTTDALGNVWTTTYDAASNVVSSTDPLNHTSTAVYDALNRPLPAWTHWGTAPRAPSTRRATSRPLPTRTTARRATCGAPNCHRIPCRIQAV